VLFTADHGDMLGDFSLWGKGCLSRSAQLNVPMMIANHPGLHDGSRSNCLANNIDIPGTVLDIAGADRPIGVSRSLVQMLNSGSPQQRDVNFSEVGDCVKIVEDGARRYCYYPFTGFGEMLRLDGCRDERITINGDAELEDKERRFLKDIVDFQAMNNGVRIKEKNLIPDTVAGVNAKHANFPKAIPFSKN
ncbi:MAG: hypothetical protein ACOC9P_01600, partial [bacterium]